MSIGIQLISHETQTLRVPYVHCWLIPFGQMHTQKTYRGREYISCLPAIADVGRCLYGYRFRGSFPHVFLIMIKVQYEM